MKKSIAKCYTLINLLGIGNMIYKDICRNKSFTQINNSIIRVFVNSGGVSKYDRIAQKHGWQIGMNSGSSSKPNQRLFMVDNDFLNYNHNRHLETVRFHRPHLATIPDILENSNQDDIYLQALELSRYCDRLILIPKTKINDVFFSLPNILLGLPVGRFQNIVTWQYAKNTDFQVHILGGSPKNQLKVFLELGYNRVYSFDTNYLSKLSSFGKIYKDFKSRKPCEFEVKSGTDFNYRCFDFSLANYPDFKDLPKQLSLF